MKNKIFRFLSAGLLGLSFAALLNLLFALLKVNTGDPMDQELFSYFADKQGLLIVIEVGFAPIFEEWIFRYLLFGKLELRIDYKWAALISAAVFAVLHWDIATGIYAFIFGLLLCEVMKRGHTWLTAVCMHVCANLFSVMVNFLPEVNRYLTDNLKRFLVLFAVLTIGSYMLYVYFTGGYQKTEEASS